MGLAMAKESTRIPVPLSPEQYLSASLRKPLLTKRETEVSCLVPGMTNGEIGERLGISEKTVGAHLRSIFLKLRIHRRSQLAFLVALCWAKENQ